MQAPQVGSRLLVAENADFCQAALPPGVDEVWCEFNVVEAESRGDFLITPSRASGPHKPLDGRAVSVFDSAPEATPANGTYLAPGSSVLLPVAGSGMSGVFMNCIVLSTPAQNGSLSVLPGRGGKQWEWRSQGDNELPSGALCVQPVLEIPDATPSAEAFEALFVLDASSAVSVAPQQLYAGLRQPLFQGATAADMKPRATRKHPKRKDAAKAAREAAEGGLQTKGASVSVGNPLSGKGGSGGGADGASGLSTGQVVAGMGVVGAAAAGAAGAAAAVSSPDIDVDTAAARNAAGSAGSMVTNALQQAASGINADPALQAAGGAAGAVGDEVASAGAVASAEAIQAANYTAYAASGAAQGAAATASEAGSTTVRGARAFNRQASAAFAPAAGAAASAASTGKQAVSSTLTAGVAAGTSFWGSSMASGAKLLDFTPPDGMYAQSRSTLVYALASAAGAAVSLFSLVKLEVLRDFFQLLSLFIANVATSAMADAKIVFGNVSSVISLDLAFVIPSINPGVIYAIILIVALILLLAYLWAMFQTRSLQMDEIREGKEVKTWDALAAEKKNTVLAIRYIFTAAFSLYLPVSRSIFEVLVCDSTMGKALNSLGASVQCTIDTSKPELSQVSCDCSTWSLYIFVAIVCGVFGVIFTLGLPYRTYQLIQRNKPVGSRENPDKRYDETGLLVDFTDEMYEDDLRTDPRQLASPYCFIYADYERKWAFYKVIVMIIKLLLAILVVALSDKVIIQTAISLLVLIVMIGFAFYSTPFLNAQADTMEISGRIANAFTVFFGLLGSREVAPDATTIMGILINTTNAINAVVMLLMILWGLNAVRTFVQRVTGVLEFDNASRRRNGGYFSTIVDKEDQLMLNLEREVKMRVWHRFWQSLLLHGFDDSVAKRLVQLQRITADVGRQRIVEHFKFAHARGPLRMYLMNEIEGVDAYWDGIPADGHLDSVTCFGKAIVYTYPFHVVMAYDDSDDYTFVWEADMPKLADTNRAPETMRRRGIRQALRAAAMSGAQFDAPWDEWVTRKVPDGTETYKDSNGHTRTRTHYSTIRVHLFFKVCKVNIGAATTLKMSRGFTPSLEYNDGAGSARKPRTGQMAHFSNEHTSVGAAAMGLPINFNPQKGPVMDVLYKPGNMAIITQTLPMWHKHCHEYRAKLRADEAKDEATLSSAFWLHVYDSLDSTQEQLQEYFNTWETNEDLRNCMTKHEAGIAYALQRVAFVRAHPCNALWYCFWEAVWDNNGTLPLLAAHAEVLDPRHSSSIAYQPMKREKLEALLLEKGVKLRGKRRWLSDAIVTSLYKHMNELSDLFQKKPREAWQGRRASVMGKATAGDSQAVAAVNPLTPSLAAAGKDMPEVAV